MDTSYCTANTVLVVYDHDHSIPDRFRPLWPALGIVGSLIITAIFILGGTLVDKWIGKQAVDDDEGEGVCGYTALVCVHTCVRRMCDIVCI